MLKPTSSTKGKVGRYPLRKIGGETRPGHYESADYLYSFETGFVWLRTVHDLSTREHLLQLEFIHHGVQFTCSFPPLVVSYSERRLCQAARRFAIEKRAEH